MDMRHVADRFQLLGDPEGPVAVAARVADENIDQMMSLEQPFGVTMLLSVAGNPVRLSKTQKDSI